MSKPRVIIAGGSGFLGLGIARFLSQNRFDPIILSRSLPPAGFSHLSWDGRSIDASQGGWAAAIDGASAIINLAGRSVDCIKTPDHCDEILRSRVESTSVLGQAVRACKSPPPLWIQMSTAHIVGDPPTAVCDEASPAGYGLAPTVGAAWEAAFDRACPAGTRRVILRTTFVVGRIGGALARLAPLARLGLGGQIGKGQQGMSWIHERDLQRIILRALTDQSLAGIYMTTAPTPVSNTVFMRELRRAVGMPIGLPAAEWMVRIAAPLLLRTDPELAIYGRYCIPTRLLQAGFDFDFPTLDLALKDLFNERAKPGQP